MVLISKGSCRRPSWLGQVDADSSMIDQMQKSWNGILTFYCDMESVYLTSQVISRAQQASGVQG